MTKLEKAKEIIKENYKSYSLGIFDCRNIVGDDMHNIYSEEGLVIDGCSYYEYFEVFGLSQDEFSELEKFYDELLSEKRRLE